MVLCSHHTGCSGWILTTEQWVGLGMLSPIILFIMVWGGLFVYQEWNWRKVKQWLIEGLWLAAFFALIAYTVFAGILLSGAYVQ